MFVDLYFIHNKIFFKIVFSIGKSGFLRTVWYITCPCLLCFCRRKSVEKMSDRKFRFRACLFVVWICARQIGRWSYFQQFSNPYYFQPSRNRRFSPVVMLRGRVVVDGLHSWRIRRFSPIASVVRWKSANRGCVRGRLWFYLYNWRLFPYSIYSKNGAFQQEWLHLTKNY